MINDMLYIKNIIVLFFLTLNILPIMMLLVDIFESESVPSVDKRSDKPTVANPIIIVNIPNQ